MIIGNVIVPIDELIFFRGVGQPPICISTHLFYARLGPPGCRNPGDPPAPPSDLAEQRPTPAGNVTELLGGLEHVCYFRRLVGADWNIWIIFPEILGMSSSQLTHVF